MSENETLDKVHKRAESIYKLGVKDGKSEKSKPRSEDAKKLDKLTDRVVSEKDGGKETPTFDSLKNQIVKIAMQPEESTTIGQVENVIRSCQSYLLGMKPPVKDAPKKVEKISN